MVPLIVVLTILIFIVVDVVVRLTLRRLEHARVAKQRGEALEVGLRLEFADEATTLKRVAVDDSKARILAVDDETIVLDSFRKILVLAGYCVDTVETGPEALSLVRKNDYDFVFTDLKMPGMDGLDVTQAVKHLRPDIDVVIITGYATVESAVEAMKHGAMDYVQKPFTEDELIDFAAKLLIRRRERIDRLTPPAIRLVTRSAKESESPRTINVPGGIFVAEEHVWARVEMSGEVRLGLDDFFHKTVGLLDNIEPPAQDQPIRRGDPLFKVWQGDRGLTFPSPLSGRVSRVNHEIVYQLDVAGHRPYDRGWICCLEPSRLTEEIKQLRIGADAVPWYEDEVRGFRENLERLIENRTAPAGAAAAAASESPEEVWRAIAASCLETGALLEQPARAPALAAEPDR